MMNVKPALTIDQQIQKLKDRGCIITDDDYAYDVLQRVNYYRLTAYLLPFKNDDDTYKTNTSFHTILKIYEFDQKLRNLISYALDFIEVEMRTRVAHEHSIEYGPLGYLDTGNFGPTLNHLDLLILLKSIKNAKKTIKLFITTC